MTRGILPVAVLLVIASAFSQFSGVAKLAVGGSDPGLGVVQRAAAGTSTSTAPGKQPVSDCKDLTPCIPRADLGPWNASCEYAREIGKPDERSPETIINAAEPSSRQVAEVAASQHGNISSAELDASLNNGPPSERRPEILRWCMSAMPPAKMDTIIVTLPDPVNSHLVLDFDRRIDAIRDAAADAGYLLDHFWLPWTGIKTNPSQNPDLKSGDRVVQQLRLDQPGLEVFRSKEPNPNLSGPVLFVFLVGETPAGGVNLGHLDKAVEYAGEVRRATGAKEVGLTRLLGPSFSGSIPALSEFLVKKSKDQGQGFQIVTSSATNHDYLRSLAKTFPGAVGSVIHDDRVALNAVADYATEQLGIQLSQVAIVAESETAYGKGFQDKVGDKTTKIRKTFHFPREIYRLRTVYPDAQAVSAGQHPEKMPAAGLDMNLKLNPGGDDGIPAFSREELPFSQEAELLAVAEAIHRDKIKLAGVAATDPFDTLFVLRFLREFCPDTRLFIVDSDVLFVRAAADYSLQGTLAVTDYPLSNAEFPSRNAEITYNALVALLGRPDRMKDYRLPKDADKNKATGPRLWLTAISTNGFQPVHVFPDDPGGTGSNALQLVSRSPKTSSSESNPTSQAPEEELEVPQIRDAQYASGSIIGIAYLIFAITSLQLACAHWAQRPSAKYLNWVLEFFHVSGQKNAQKACFVAISFLILIVLNVFIFFPIWRIAYVREDFASTGSYIALGLLGACGILASFRMAVLLFIQHRAYWQTAERLVAILSFGMLVLYAGVWGAICCCSHDSSLFVQRCLNLSNGVSPLIPHFLVLIVLYLWSLAHIRRIHLWHARRQSISLQSLDAEYQSNFHGLEGDLSRVFSELAPRISREVIPLLVVLAALVASARPLAHLASVEPVTIPLGIAHAHLNVFDASYVVYLTLCAVLLGGALSRFVLGWSALLNILRRLERQPIRHAFDRLPKKFYSWTPLWHSGGARRSFAVQTRALECFEKLLSYSQSPDFPKALVADLENRIQSLRRSTASLLAGEAEGELDFSAKNATCRDMFASAADTITSELLLPYWRNQGDCESIEQHEKAQADKPDKGVRHVFQEKHPPVSPSEFIVVAEEFVALRFVAFMRYVGGQLRNMLSFVVAGFILCVASVRSYPFLAQRTIGWGLTVTFLVIGIPVVIAFAQMDKDAILSRLSDTDPGKLDRAFYVRLISYGGLPFLTVLASQFPAVGRFLFSWVQPAIEAMH